MGGYALIILSCLVLALSIYRAVLLRWAAGKPTDGGGATLVPAAASGAAIMFVPASPLIAIHLSINIFQDLAAVGIAGLVLYGVMAGGLTVLAKRRLALGLAVANPGRGSLIWTAGSVVLIIAVVLGRDWFVRRQLDHHRHQAIALASSLKPTIPLPEQNAARLYQQAIAQMSTIPAQAMNWETAATAGDEPDLRPEILRAPQFPADQEATIKLLHQASAMEQADWVEDYARLTAMSNLPWLTPMRQAAMLLKWHALCLIRKGNIQGAISDINAIRAMADHIPYPPTLVSSAVAIGVDGGVRAVVEELLAKVKDPAMLSEITLRPADWGEKLTALGLRGESALTTVSLADTLDGQVAAVVAVPEAVIPLYRLVAGDRDILSIQREYAQTSDELEAGEIHLDRKARRDSLLATLLLPPVGPAARMAAAARVNELCVSTAVQAKRYQLERGRLPASLQELKDAGYIKTLPLDPFASGPLQCRIVDGELRIYSVGVNGTDEQGDSEGRHDDIGIRVR